MRNLAVEWLLALRYLRARREEGSLSIIAGFSLVGIALGVATLIIVMSVMGGFRQELLDRILGLNGRLAVLAGQAGMSGFDEAATRLRSVPGVRAVTPVAEGEGIVAVHGHTRGVLVRGIRPSDLRGRDFVLRNLVGGSLEDFSGKRTIVVGDRLLSALGLKIGDSITLISSQTIATPLGLMPRMGSFRIVAAFELGMYDYDSRYIFMPLEAAQAFFNLPGAVTMLEIRVDRGADVGTVERKVLPIASTYGSLINWERSNQGFFSVVRTQANVLFLILTLIIVVAAFNIVSSLFILVRTKAPEIGVLRTIGATRGGVMRIFVMAGLVLGGIGTAAGVVLGVIFASNIESIRQAVQRIAGVELFSAKLYFLTQLPAVVDYGTVVVVAAMALGLALVAALYPAWKAASLDPIEALRDE